MPKPGRTKFMNIVLERGAAVVVDPNNPNVVFVGGSRRWSFDRRSGQEAFIIAIRPGTPGHEAAARVRHSGGANFLTCDGSVRVMDELAKTLRSYRKPMQAQAFGDANLLLPAVTGRVRASGILVTPGASSPALTRAAPNVLLFTDAAGDGSVMPWEVQQILIALLIP